MFSTTQQALECQICVNLVWCKYAVVTQIVQPCFMLVCVRMVSCDETSALSVRTWPLTLLTQ
jgi:hypothetical protein